MPSVVEHIKKIVGAEPRRDFDPNVRQTLAGAAAVVAGAVVLGLGREANAQEVAVTGRNYNSLARFWTDDRGIDFVRLDQRDLSVLFTDGESVNDGVGSSELIRLIHNKVFGVRSEERSRDRSTSFRDVFVLNERLLGNISVANHTRQIKYAEEVWRDKERRGLDGLTLVTDNLMYEYFFDNYGKLSIAATTFANELNSVGGGIVGDKSYILNIKLDENSSELISFSVDHEYFEDFISKSGLSPDYFIPEQRSSGLLYVLKNEYIGALNDKSPIRKVINSILQKPFPQI